MSYDPPIIEPESGQTRLNLDEPSFVGPAVDQTGETDATCRRIVTRRKFLAALGGSAVVAVAGGYGISVWGRNPTAPDPVGPTGTPLVPVPTTGSFVAGPRTLVVIEMGGGNDGLNTVVPHATSRYHDVRRGLAIDEPIDLDGEVGLHPNLVYLADRYAAGDVAIVEGIGYPDPDLSHFASMANWWSATQATYGTTGWLGRYVDGVGGAEDPLAAISVGPGPTPALLGESSFVVAIQDFSGLTPRVAPWIDANDELMGLWQSFAPARIDPTTMAGQVQAAIVGTVGAADSVNDMLENAVIDDVASTNLGQSMSVAAALAGSPTPPRVIYVHGWGDFDTHQGEAQRHGALMQELDDALRSFFGTVEAAGRGSEVAVMTTSEFGRRVAFNGSGTDHGTANSHFVVGAGVAGGRYGEPASLTRLDVRGNLVHTVDFRSYYASILDGWLEAPHEGVLGQTWETMPIFG